MSRYIQKTTKSGWPIILFLDDPDFERLRELGCLTDSNEHNPLVAAVCPVCNGKGTWGEYRGDVHCLIGCQNCGGIGVLDSPVLLFATDNHWVDVIPNAVGAVKCPGCSKTFKISDKRRWSGKRHRCGQKLRIVPTIT